ncbi:hypothetical protein GCM10022199_23300 [Marihabitans asiaticum]|uniref:Uncharacterized protein n=1 Tax=Marihabitans asiaticum TaxID=415218 RepID=A0A560W9Z5_9MICO|nr:hypothetical protein [Marihabitans asiaticum]TWD14448.1 hypothetical protein FB557_1858 [Marihabitans asiaticum]
MTFIDLPRDWPSRSLTDLRLAADVVDLVVREGDRWTGSVSLLLCSDDGRMIQPVTVSDVPQSSTEEDRRAFFDAFLDHLGRALGSVVLALGRPGEQPCAEDLAWHGSALTACRAAGVELIATFAAAPEEVRLVGTGQVPLDLAG